MRTIARPSAPPRVLLIEDNPGTARGLRELLISRGYGVDVETDAVAGLRRATEGDYGLVVTDCDLGRQDGAEIVRRIRLLKPDVPVLVVTARDRGGVIEGLGAVGVVECLEKPVRPETLLAAVERRFNPVDPS